MRFLLATCLLTFFSQHLWSDSTPMSSATYSNSGEQFGVPDTSATDTSNTSEPESTKQEEQARPGTDKTDFQIGPYKGNEYQYKVNHEDDYEQQ